MSETDTKDAAVAFFQEHAGWSFDPATETPEQGRLRGAHDLAEAERWAWDAGYEAHWEVDDLGHDDLCGIEGCRTDHGTAYVCVLFAPDGSPAASLGGVTFGPGKGPGDDPYRRVVEAELASEAQGRHHDGDGPDGPLIGPAKDPESDYAPGGYVARDVLVGLIDSSGVGEENNAITDIEYPGEPDSASRSGAILLLENGERYRVTVEYVPEERCPQCGGVIGRNVEAGGCKRSY